MPDEMKLLKLDFQKKKKMWGKKNVHRNDNSHLKEKKEEELLQKLLSHFIPLDSQRNSD